MNTLLIILLVVAVVGLVIVRRRAANEPMPPSKPTRPSAKQVPKRRRTHSYDAELAELMKDVRSDTRAADRKFGMLRPSETP